LPVARTNERSEADTRERKKRRQREKGKRRSRPIGDNEVIIPGINNRDPKGRLNLKKNGRGEQNRPQLQLGDEEGEEEERRTQADR